MLSKVAFGVGSLCFGAAKRLGANLGLSLGAGAVCALGVGGARMAYEKLSGDTPADYYAQKAIQLEQLDLKPIFGIPDFRTQSTAVGSDQLPAKGTTLPIAKTADLPKDKSVEHPKAISPFLPIDPPEGWETNGGNGTSSIARKPDWEGSSVLDINRLMRVFPVE